MTQLTYSGLCLAAIFGSVAYEHRRLKKEEAKLKETLMELAKQSRTNNQDNNNSSLLTIKSKNI